ncbi:hypothetical protein Daura_09305 [Dactylosporangium aurantiacum]|uniref:Uncharacterized protein n=1 Tax=Dactylosporangium aurantiacum TaxID=35754 RepID=A0A9Q9MH49_9ACTN|nr:hypothetical protein [Dactylosporangium aurantiacum]MDG6109712.1 hypothetical protein [Dactylosporangium aurantiacum]UWZ56349.1 hypothetical protein Daura_09305 [Dactylosporangium aurantiacum]
MSDDYTPFSADLDGDGVEDQAVIYTTEDGANVIVGDLDGDGQADFAALDEDGNGVYEQSYNALTDEYTDLTAQDTADYDGSGGNLDGDIAQYDTADYDGSGGNLDGDVSGGMATAEGNVSGPAETDTETADAGASSGGYYDAAAVSDMMAMQHETSMAIINNI